MTEFGDDLGILVDAIAALKRRTSNDELVLADVVRYLGNPGNLVQQIGAGNPLLSDSQVDIVRVTSVDPAKKTWTGLRQRRNDAGNLIDSPNLLNPISGDLGVSTKLPSVDDKIAVVFTGQDRGDPESLDHSMMVCGGFRRVRGTAIGDVAAGDNFSLKVTSTLEGRAPGGISGASIAVWNIGNATHKDHDELEAEYNDTELRWEVFAGGGGGGGGHDGFLVLIDDDVSPAQEYDPPRVMTSLDATLNPDKLQVIFQDPPDDDFTRNVQPSFDLRGIKATKLNLKVFAAPDKSISGKADTGNFNSITLASGASTTDAFYDDDNITITKGTGIGQSRVIGDYDGSNRKATVDVDWDVPPDSTSEYEITSDAELILDTTIIDDTSTTPARKIVRYVTREVWYLDGKGFDVGEYQVDDYSTYPENEVFPPDGSGTFQQPPDGFFKKRYRAEVTYANGKYWIDFATCKELPAPPLVPVA